MIRLVDLPVWLSVLDVGFKVRGRLVTHGLVFAAIGSQEPGSKALALACVERLKLESFWDVGANIGYYTWLLKSASPALRAVLFEAAPANAHLVRTTLNRNKLLDVELIAAGAADCQGEGYSRVDSLAGTACMLGNPGAGALSIGRRRPSRAPGQFWNLQLFCVPAEIPFRYRNRYSMTHSALRIVPASSNLNVQ
jgi:hypothetical protein